MTTPVQYCICMEEPRGRYGLEGYTLNHRYRCEFRVQGSKDGKPYWRVWPSEDSDYYETCSERTFHTFFLRWH